MSLVCLASSLLLAGRVYAADPLDRDTRDAARKLGYSGVEAFQAGNYQAASEKLEKAYRVAPVPSLGLWSARALAKVGKLVEAAERYAEVTQLRVSSGDQAVQKRAQADAAVELAAIKPKIPSLTVQLEGAPASEVSVAIDGQPMPGDLVDRPQPINPGLHRIEASRADKRVTVEVTLNESDQKPVLLTLGTPTATPPATAAVPEPATAPAAPAARLGTQRTLAIVAGSVGVVGVTLGTVFGLKSKSLHDDAAPYCSGQVCTDQRGVDAGKDAYSAGTVSTVAMVVGVLGLAGGATLWLTAPRAQEAPRAALHVGPGSINVRGCF